MTQGTLGSQGVIPRNPRSLIFKMRWTGSIKSVYIDLPEDLHEAVRSMAPRRKMTARAAYIQAAERWLDNVASTPTETTSTQRQLSKEQFPDKNISAVSNLQEPERAWVLKLLKVLRSGKPGFIRAVTENLEIFATYCDLEPPEIGGINTPQVGPGDQGGSGDVGKVKTPHRKPSGSLQNAVARIDKRRTKRNSPQRKHEGSRSDGD